MQAIKRILAAELSWRHFSLCLFINYIITYAMFFVTWAAYCLIFGVNESGRKEAEMPLNRFIANFTPLFVGLIIVSTGAFLNNKRGNLSAAKSYLILVPVLIVLNLFAILFYFN
jgi:hypothetical protein